MLHTAPGHEPARRDDTRHVPSTTRRPSRSRTTMRSAQRRVDNRTVPTPEQLDGLPDRLRVKARLTEQPLGLEIDIDATGRPAIIATSVIAGCCIAVALIALLFG